MTWGELCALVQLLADYYPTWVVRAGRSGEDEYAMTVWEETSFRRTRAPIFHICESATDLNHLFPPEARL